MKNILDRFNLIRMVGRLFNRRFLRAIAVVLAALIAVESLIIWRVFQLSRDHLIANDPRQLQNRSETAFYFAPLKLSRGMTISRDDVLAYLNDLSFYSSEAPHPASFFVEQERLSIRSRNPSLFPDVSLQFGRGRLSSIESNGNVLETIELEPLPLQNVIDYVDPDSIKKDLRTRRIVLEPGSVPALVSDAVTSTEDKTFYQNQGVNWYSVVLRPILSLGRQGGSSLSQQLIKNNVVEGSKDGFWQIGVDSIDKKFAGLQRKIAEIPMAQEINRMMSKDEILAAYLSMNYMGTVSGVDLQGFAVASQEFYGTNLFDLSDSSDPEDVARVGALSGMIQAPGSYLKFVRNGEKCETAERFCKNLLNRRNAVLDLMRENMPEKYSADLIARAKMQPLGIEFASKKRTDRPIQAESRNFASYAASTTNLPSELKELRREAGQVGIITSLEVHLQKAAAQILRKATARIQKNVDRVYRKQRAENEGKFAVVERKCAEGSKSIEVDCKNLFKIQASLIAVDIKSGQILAMSSGIDINAKRSPGSLIKPFFYLKGIENGFLKGQPFTAATIIRPETDKGELQAYCTEEENLGGTGSVRKQLAMSWNLGACLTAQSAGIPTDFVGKLTNSSPEEKLIAALGGTKGSEVSLPDIVQAYTIFPNNGKMTKITAYKSAYQVEGQRARIIQFSRPASAVVADPSSAFVTTQLMKSVVTNGTGAGFVTASGLSADSVAGKSGSGMISDLWWINFTPGIVVGVWVGMPSNLPELRLADGFAGGKTSSPIAAEFMRSVARYRPDLLDGRFSMPNNVVKLRINPHTGCHVETGGTEEYFLVGREPANCRY